MVEVRNEKPSGSLSLYKRLQLELYSRAYNVASYTSERVFNVAGYTGTRIRYLVRVDKLALEASSKILPASINKRVTNVVEGITSTPHRVLKSAESRVDAYLGPDLPSKMETIQNIASQASGKAEAFMPQPVAKRYSALKEWASPHVYNWAKWFGLHKPITRDKVEHDFKELDGIQGSDLELYRDILMGQCREMETDVRKLHMRSGLLEKVVEMKKGGGKESTAGVATASADFWEAQVDEDVEVVAEELGLLTRKKTRRASFDLQENIPAEFEAEKGGPTNLIGSTRSFWSASNSKDHLHEISEKQQRHFSHPFRKMTTMNLEPEEAEREAKNSNSKFYRLATRMMDDETNIKGGLKPTRSTLFWESDLTIDEMLAIAMREEEKVETEDGGDTSGMSSSSDSSPSGSTHEYFLGYDDSEQPCSKAIVNQGKAERKYGNVVNMKRELAEDVNSFVEMIEVSKLKKKLRETLAIEKANGSYREAPMASRFEDICELEYAQPVKPSEQPTHNALDAELASTEDKKEAPTTLSPAQAKEKVLEKIELLQEGIQSPSGALEKLESLQRVVTDPSSKERFMKTIDDLQDKFEEKLVTIGTASETEIEGASSLCETKTRHEVAKELLDSLDTVRQDIQQITLSRPEVIASLESLTSGAQNVDEGPYLHLKADDQLFLSHLQTDAEESRSKAVELVEKLTTMKDVCMSPTSAHVLTDLVEQIEHVSQTEQELVRDVASRVLLQADEALVLSDSLNSMREQIRKASPASSSSSLGLGALDTVVCQMTELENKLSDKREISTVLQEMRQDLEQLASGTETSDKDVSTDLKRQWTRGEKDAEDDEESNDGKPASNDEKNDGNKAKGPTLRRQWAKNRTSGEKENDDEEELNEEESKDEASEGHLDPMVLEDKKSDVKEILGELKRNLAKAEEKKSEVIHRIEELQEMKQEPEVLEELKEAIESVSEIEQLVQRVEGGEKLEDLLFEETKEEGSRSIFIDTVERLRVSASSSELQETLESLEKTSEARRHENEKEERDQNHHLNGGVMEERELENLDSLEPSARCERRMEEPHKSGECDECDVEELKDAPPVVGKTMSENQQLYGLHKVPPVRKRTRFRLEPEVQEIFIDQPSEVSEMKTEEDIKEECRVLLLERQRTREMRDKLIEKNALLDHIVNVEKVKTCRYYICQDDDDAEDDDADEVQVLHHQAAHCSPKSPEKQPEYAMSKSLAWYDSDLSIDELLEKYKKDRSEGGVMYFNMASKNFDCAEVPLESSKSMMFYDSDAPVDELLAGNKENSNPQEKRKKKGTEKMKSSMTLEVPEIGRSFVRMGTLNLMEDDDHLRMPPIHSPSNLFWESDLPVDEMLNNAECMGECTPSDSLNSGGYFIGDDEEEKERLKYSRSKAFWESDLTVSELMSMKTCDLEKLRYPTDDARENEEGGIEDHGNADGSSALERKEKNSMELDDPLAQAA